MFGLLVEYAYALLGDVVVAAVAHFCVCLVSHRVYKRIDCLFGAERGRAARLARGAHNPKVGSSNLPPATILKTRVFWGSFVLGDKDIEILDMTLVNGNKVSSICGE